MLFNEAEVYQNDHGVRNIGSDRRSYYSEFSNQNEIRNSLDNRTDDQRENGKGCLADRLQNIICNVGIADRNDGKRQNR